MAGAARHRAVDRKRDKDALVDARVDLAQLAQRQLVERDANPPVNMSKHLRHTVPAKYGRGATMVFEAPVGSSCDGFTVKRQAKDRTTQNTDELLDNLAQQYDWSRPSNQYRRADGWIADVEF